MGRSENFATPSLTKLRMWKVRQHFDAKNVRMYFPSEVKRGQNHQ